MVDTFIQGIAPELQDQAFSFLSEIFDKYPEIIITYIKSTNNRKSNLKKQLKDISIKILDDYFKLVDTYKRAKYVDPVLGVVGILPKDELAAMAESLVNITSFKRKVSMESETVGGPIDVALISKGDGFVWVKRKHYFKAELNPQFFANYYNEELM